jgi:hypothetical protein
VVVVVAVVVLPLPPWPLPSTTVVPPHAHNAHKKSCALMHPTVRSLIAVGKHGAWRYDMIWPMRRSASSCANMPSRMT